MIDFKWKYDIWRFAEDSMYSIHPFIFQTAYPL